MNKYAPKKIDKIEAQKLYNSGLSMRGLAKHYSVCINTISNLKLKTRNVADANRLKAKDISFSTETLQKLSRLAKERNLGGYRPHPNRGERYKDIWFDSKWEVYVAKSLDENNIIWSRPTKGFVWTDNNKKYYPDFYLTEYDVYLDPKNDYLIKKDENKISEAQKRNNIKVLVLTKDQLDWSTIKTLL